MFLQIIYLLFNFNDVYVFKQIIKSYFIESESRFFVFGFIKVSLMLVEYGLYEKLC